MRKITEIIIHCSATRANQSIGAAEIRAMHLARGWTDIGYNYVIRRSGLVEAGRDRDHDGDLDEEIGAHTLGHNAGSLGICLIGGAGPSGQGEANFTREQMIALRAFLVAKREEYPDAALLGHRDTGAKKDCPSFDVTHWWETDELIRPRNIS